MRSLTLSSSPDDAGDDAANGFVDGRVLRGENNRKRTIEAFLSLVAEGIIDPTAEDVANRAGVGLRSIFRYFKDMEMLYRELATHSEHLVRRMSAAAFSEEVGEGRLEEVIDARTSVYEELMPFHIAIRAHAHQSAFLRLYLENFADFQRATLLESFPRDWLKDKVLLEAINLVLSVDTWLRLRRDQRLNRAFARRVLALSCRSLLQSEM